MGYKTENLAWQRMRPGVITVNESSFWGGILDPMIAIENGPFRVDLPINHGIFFVSMLVYQRVYYI